MISKWFTKGLVLTSLSLLFLFHSGASIAQTMKVALVLPGPVSDKGFNASAHKGLMFVKKKLGDKVEVAFSESVQRPDFVSSIRDYANRGYDVIYAHGFQWGDAIAKVAAENPKKKFINLYGIGKAPNLANLHVICLARDTGRIRWHQRLWGTAPTRFHGNKSSMASPSPVTDGRHVWAFFGTGDVFCFCLLYTSPSPRD